MAGSESNGSIDATKYSSHMRPFTQRNRYRIMATALSTVNEKNIVGSQTSLASISGSMHNILEPGKLMSMQEDARSRKISTEVIKRSLYKSVTAPCRRRMMNRMSYCSNSSRFDDSMTASQTSSSAYTPRMFQSLPVTPAQSLAVTPSHSPTSNKSFFYGFLSRGTTPRCTTPEPLPEDLNAEDEVEGVDCRGLATLFRPHPRYISASGDVSSLRGFVDLNESQEFNSEYAGATEDEHHIKVIAPAKVSCFRNNSSFKRKDQIVKNPNNA